MDLLHDNIDNLTSLWKTVGQPIEAYHATVYFDYCVVSDSESPNKLWSHGDVNEERLTAAKHQLRTLPTEVGVPYFDIHASQSYRLLEANGFEQQSEQIGMVLPLSQHREQPEDLYLQEVSTEEEAKQWEDIFRRAFGYHISYRLLLPHYETTHFWTAYHRDGEPVGTAVLHHTDDRVMGIHSMSILPEMRRKGLAEQMMRQLLNQSLRRGFGYATLQASEMGRGLYQKLGFDEQFVMKNYALKPAAV